MNPALWKAIRVPDRRMTVVALALLLSAFTWMRYKTLLEFNYVYMDGDQGIMWKAVQDYAAGDIHEPRFYGQPYNSMLEALFAVPFFAAGYHPQFVLPVITSILTAFPFILLALLLVRRKHHVAAILVATIPLLLPPEYQILTSMPRGFVTGLFLTSFCFPLIFRQDSRPGKYDVALLVTGGAAAVAGYSLNPNSILVSAPVCLIFLGQNLSRRRDLIWFAAGATGAFLIHVAVGMFYVFHPEYVLHSFTLHYDIATIASAMSNLDTYLNDVSPVFWRAGSLTLAIFVILSAHAFIRKERLKGLVILMLPAMIILTLGLNKVHDGTNSIFFSYSRMFIGLPLMVALAVSLVPLRNVLIALPAFALAAIFTFTYVPKLSDAIGKQFRPNVNHVETVERTDILRRACTAINNIAKQHKAELIIVADHGYYSLYTYACPVCEENFPNTLRPVYERRTWRMLEDEQRVYRTVLVVHAARDLAGEYPAATAVEGHDHLYLIRENQLRTMELLDTLRIPYRPYKPK